VPRLHLHALFALTLLVPVIAGSRALAPPAVATHGAFGRGAPIVLLHGLGSRSEDWLPVARQLARNHRVELVDLPGHGESDMPEPFSLERVTAALDRTLGEVDRRPVILVGHSLGGLLAAAETIEHPERARGLVLIETALRPQVPEAQRGELLDRLEHDYQSLLHAAYLDFGRDLAQGEMLYQRVATLEPRMMQRWIRLAWTADLSEQTARLTVPVLVVLADRSWGRRESWAVAAEALGYRGASRLRPIRLSDCGHFVMLDRPAELAALIESFASDPEGLRVARR
jgi:3-oxoadipate enol-lactonase